MEMRFYHLTIKHDNGTFRVKTPATCEQSAKQAVMIAEGCPEGAITKVRVGKKL